MGAVAYAAAIERGQDLAPGFDTALDRHRLVEAVALSSAEGRRVSLPG